MSQEYSSTAAPDHHAGEDISPHVLRAEIHGLRQAVNTKFDGFQTVLNEMRGWMGRLTTTVEKLAENSAHYPHQEKRLDLLELELRGLRDQMQSNRDNTTRNNAFIGVAAVVGTALVGALVTVALGLL